MIDLLVLAGIGWLLYLHHTTTERIMATQAEHAQALRDLTAQNDKVAAEQAAALKKLQEALDAAGGTTPEVDAAMAELKASIQAEDDLNPDAAEPEAPASFASRGKIGAPPKPPRDTAV